MVRLYNRQIVNYPFFKAKADNQHNVLIKLKPRRGSVYDANNRLLALDINVKSLFAVSRSIEDKRALAVKLSKILKTDENEIEKKLYRDKAFVWLKRKISVEEEKAVKELDNDNLGLVIETKRSYPKGRLLCHVTGFTDMDNTGIEGLELYYNDFLNGRDGWKKLIRDAKRKLISSYEEYLPAKEGYNIVLTVDEVIQDIVENEIDNIVKNHKPRSVMIIAGDPDTGAILAMANYPYFDLNKHSSTPPGMLKNKCITAAFEPGSVFKIITASAVIEEGAVSEEDVFFCENGEYKVKNRILHDHRPYGNLTFKEIIQKSSNIGAVKAAATIGKDKLFKYIKKFGFGEKSGIDLYGDENGILRDKDAWSYVDMTTIPMGQGISVTAIQIEKALSCVANGGLLMKPYVVKDITDSQGRKVREFNPRIIRRVISEDTSARIRAIMKNVVDNGTGKRAQIKGFAVGGKTGTAQKVDENGRYSKNKYVASFMGFAPCDDPKVTLVVCVDEPKGTYYGGTVAAPAFKNIMEKILHYKEVNKDADEI